MEEKEIQAYIKQGFLRVAVIFEVVGKPKEHVEKTLKDYVKKVKEESEIKVLNEAYDAAEEVKDNFFSAVAELEVLVANIEKLTWLCVNFTPASIELIEPDHVKLEQSQITHWLNDMLSRLHQIGMQTKQLNSHHQSLVRNFNAMTRNAILLALREPLDTTSIGRKIGLDEKNTEKFLEALIVEQKIMKDKNVYRLMQ